MYACAHTITHSCACVCCRRVNIYVCVRVFRRYRISHCTSVTFSFILSSETGEVCYTGMGQSYRGTAYMTISRNKCTPWSHQFYVKTSDYPELAGGHNFCRNPGEMEDKPWCYTEYNQREKCDVPKCGKEWNMKN